MSKLKDGLQLKGEGKEIADVDRYDLPAFFVEMGYKTGVEIGVEKGKFTEKLAQAGLKVYGVDPFLVYKGFDNDPVLNQPRIDILEGMARKRLEKYNVTLIKKMSMDAVEDFEDNSIDFVYIDGNHGFRYVAEDIWEWHRRVRPGGLVSGHDFALGPWPVYSGFAIHVPYVLPVVTKILGVKDWYVLGEYKGKPGEKREKFRSWFYVKP
jgi:SAM-dependent methyltransferase